VRLLLKKQHPGSRQPHSATILKRWRGEESPSVLRRRGCQSVTLVPLCVSFIPKIIMINSLDFIDFFGRYT
ncbi:MAG: hypothetical protein EWV49_18620, partial [Microcystis aeruginosa Ma_QC_Ch_20071001_S25]